MDETFFLGGMPKAEVLKGFCPHISFENQTVHCEHAAQFVPRGGVPYLTRSSRTPG
ncbi:MAG: 5'-nucleotidase [Cyanobacteriota bacterium]